MKHVYLICYDVAEPSRLRKVYKCLLGAGESLQYSVFRCELSAQERQALIERLWGLLNLREDRLLVANLGISDGTGAEALQKDIRWRAFDVNRPVTPSCAFAEALAVR